MSKGYNPYRGPDGRFDFGPKKQRIIYAQSDEYDDALEAQEDLKESQISKQAEERKRLAAEEVQKDKDKEVEAIKAEIQTWIDIQNDPYGSPYLKEQSFKELKKLRKRLDKFK